MDLSRYFSCVNNSLVEAKELFELLLKVSFKKKKSEIVPIRG
jgi:hypothetical protein